MMSFDDWMIEYSRLLRAVLRRLIERLSEQCKELERLKSALEEIARFRGGIGVAQQMARDALKKY